MIDHVYFTLPVSGARRILLAIQASEINSISNFSGGKYCFVSLLQLYFENNRIITLTTLFPVGCHVCSTKKKLLYFFKFIFDLAFNVTHILSPNLLHLSPCWLFLTLAYSPIFVNISEGTWRRVNINDSFSLLFLLLKRDFVHTIYTCFIFPSLQFYKFLPTTSFHVYSLLLSFYKTNKHLRENNR